MDTRLPVNHYLHLREQDEPHDKALAHTVQRYGVLPATLLEALYESKRHHVAVAALLPTPPDVAALLATPPA
jgi:hypothetical protein